MYIFPLIQHWARHICEPIMFAKKPYLHLFPFFIHIFVTQQSGNLSYLSGVDSLAPNHVCSLENASVVLAIE